VSNGLLDHQLPFLFYESDHDCSFDEIFGFYRWVPLKPELIEYPNAQVLLIGRARREVSSVVPEGKREDRMRADQELEEMARRNEERENHFRGSHPFWSCDYATLNKY
jgi:hypothetical protein